ncbi:MAG: UDP-glucose/GDP-mannose dehydrogenase family protein [Clostridiales bacterium]|nr:UDP-glucose/GDP-mannose dehydrogenase family protein [Clostridiales bacterium]MCF8023159.1 UDP-glucose/GDP-mannose dehydrogenase family protein [Clostridiales bacterium]
MKITIIGCGYVGLTTSVALAYIGHDVHCIDQNEQRIKALQNGEVPIHEMGVAELLDELHDRLSFGLWDSFDENSDVIVIAVGTPRKDNGDADLTYVETVAKEIGERLSGNSMPVIVNKSTVPIGSARRVESVVKYHLQNRDINMPVRVASAPEFLREGVALLDTFYPDRIVVGAADNTVINTLREMFAPILEQTFTPPEFLPRPDGYSLPAFITTTPASAELIKYAANTFLAMKISYINEVAGLAERVGADIKEVARGIGLDRRIGISYLNAGIGWGGSCFGKDVQALIHTAGQYEYEMPLSSATVQVNMRQREDIIKKLQSVLKVLRGSTIGLLGLSFKPGTDDLRDAPSITIASRLTELGAHVKAYDPVAVENCCRTHPELDIEYVNSTEALAAESDALVLVTEWKEFIRLSYAKLGELMRQKIIIDGRNILDGQALKKEGFNYIGVGV